MLRNGPHDATGGARVASGRCVEMSDPEHKVTFTLQTDERGVVRGSFDGKSVDFSFDSAEYAIRQALPVGSELAVDFVHENFERPIRIRCSVLEVIIDPA